jgi:hypothetical protein
MIELIELCRVEINEGSGICTEWFYESRSGGSSADDAQGMLSDVSEAMRRLKMRPSRPDMDVTRSGGGGKRLSNSDETWKRSGNYVGAQMPSSTEIDSAMKKNGWKRSSSDSKTTTYSHKDDRTATAVVRRLTGERNPAIEVRVEVKNGDMQSKPDLANHPRTKAFMKFSKAVADALSAIADVDVVQKPALKDTGYASGRLSLTKKNGKGSSMRDVNKYANAVMSADPGASITRKYKGTMYLESGGGDSRGGMEYMFQVQRDKSISLAMSSNVSYGLD